MHGPSKMLTCHQFIFNNSSNQKISLLAGPNLCSSDECWDVICFIRAGLRGIFGSGRPYHRTVPDGGITAGMGRGPEWPPQDSNLGPIGLKA